MNLRMRRRIVKSTIGVSYITILMLYVSYMRFAWNITEGVDLKTMLIDYTTITGLMYVLTIAMVVVTGTVLEFRKWINEVERKEKKRAREKRMARRREEIKTEYAKSY